MRRRSQYSVLVFAVGTVFAAAPRNTMSIGSAGSAEAGHPVTFGRAFRQGEIAGYAKPLMNGVAPANWQNDQVKRWRDGRSSCEITAITATVPPQVTCANHGFRSGEVVSISGTESFDGQHKITYWTRDKFILGSFPAATNIFPYTKQYDRLQASNVTITADVTTDPLGNNTAEKIAENTVDGFHTAYYSMRVPAATYTWSHHLKAAERTYAVVGHWNAAAQRAEYVIANLSTCAITAQVYSTGTATAAANGYCRVTLTFTGVNDPGESIFVGPARDSSTPGYAGTAGRGVYASMGQLEAGAATPYSETLIAFSGTATAAGPGPGSLKWAVVSYVADLAASGNTAAVSFQDSASRTSDEGYQSPSANDILNFNGGNWNAAIRYSQTGTTTRTVDARSMIGAGNYRVRLDGPAVWEVIAEDRTATQAYDFGITCTSGCTGDYSSATWADDAASKAVHPYFILRFYRGWGGVRIRYVSEQASTADLRDQRFTFTLLSGPSLAVTQWSGTHTVYGRQRFTRPVDSSGDGSWNGDWEGYWDGLMPVAHTINHNANYLRSTKMVPFYEPQAVVNEATISYDFNQWKASDRAPGTGDALAYKNYHQAGYYPRIGLLPRWAAILTISPNDRRIEEMAVGRTLLHGNLPTHWREFSGAAKYARYLDLDGNGNSANDAAAPMSTGRVISLDARPKFTWGAEMEQDVSGIGGGYHNGDPVTYGTPYGSTAHGWSGDQSHMGEAGYVQYLLSGDYFLEEELQFWGAWGMSGGDPGTPLWNSNFRHGSTAWLAYGGLRGVAWALRVLAIAYEISPDGSPEKEYFYSKLNNNLQSYEGIFKIQGGEYYNPVKGAPASAPCAGFHPELGDDDLYTPDTFTPYCRGWVTLAIYGGGSQMGMLQVVSQDNSQGENGRYCWSGETDLSVAYACCPQFTQWYLAAVVGFVDQLVGAPAVAERVGRNPVGMMNASGGPYVYNVGFYSAPIADGQWTMIPTIERFRASLSAWARGRTSYMDGYSHQSDEVPWGCHTYMQDFRTALSFYVKYNSYGSGLEAWDKLMGTPGWTGSYVRQLAWDKYVPGQSLCTGNNPNNVSRYSYPNGGIVAAFDGVDQVGVATGDTYAVVTYRKPRADKACTVSFDGGGAVSDGVTDNRWVQFAQTGLSPSTTGTVTINCADDPYGLTTAEYRTAAASSGSGSYSWQVSGQTRVLAGETAGSLTPASEYADCSAGCSVTLAKGLKYVQLQRQDGSTGPIIAVAVN